MRPRFMVDVFGKKWKCHTALILYCCGSPEEKDMFGVKHGVTMYSCIRYLTSMNDIGEPGVGPTRIAYERDALFKSLKHQYTVYV